MDNIFLVTFLIWPAAILVSALLSMAIWRTFSWSELILDYVVGVLCGICHFTGTDPDAGFFGGLFLLMSNGLFGALYLAGAGFLAERTTLLTCSLIAVPIATVVAAALDHAAIRIGRTQTTAGGLFSGLLCLFKVPFSLLTTAVGTLMFLVGIFRSFVGTGGKVGFLGGVMYVEWNRNNPNTFATTLGATVQVWSGNIGAVIDHELYHTRQYIYLHDWLTPTWLVGGIWGLISGAAAGKRVSFEFFSTASQTRELGNPLERAAYRISGGSFCN